MVTEQGAALERRLTELEAENAQLRRQLREAAAAEEQRATRLMAEVQHRVRNMLATVRAIVTRTAASSTTIEDFAAHLTGRVETLARLQGALMRTGETGLDLEELVREEFVVQGGSGADPSVEGPSLFLTGRHAEMLGLAIHELATNSVKFGALSVQDGHVAVDWRVSERQDGTGLSLSWAESGAPPGPDQDRRGFGREFLEDGLPYQLGAETRLEFRPGGLHCTIDLVLQHRSRLGAPVSAPACPQ